MKKLLMMNKYYTLYIGSTTKNVYDRIVIHFLPTVYNQQYTNEIGTELQCDHHNLFSIYGKKWIQYLDNDWMNHDV